MADFPKIVLVYSCVHKVINITLKPDNLILYAFDLQGKIEPLPGGQNNSWRIGDHVLEYVGIDPSNEWSAAVLSDLNAVDYRISAPVRSKHDSFVFKGWLCSKFEVGFVSNNHEAEKLEVSRLFHRSLKAISLNVYVPPSNRWEIAHRAAWSRDDLPSQIETDSRNYIKELFRFTNSQGDIKTQIIHGDLAGNILFHDRYSPLIIDFSPTNGPIEYAESILIADSIAWYNAPLQTLELLPQTEYYKDMLLRAVIFRLVVSAQVPDQKVFTETRNCFQRIIHEIMSS